MLKQPYEFFEYLAMRIDEGALSYEEVVSHMKKKREEKIATLNKALKERNKENLIPNDFKGFKLVEEKTEEKEVAEN